MDQKVTALTELTTPDRDDLLPIVDDPAGTPVTKKIKLKNLPIPVLAYKSADQTLIGTSFVDVSGVGLAVEANTVYLFEFFLICDADATTTGIDVSCNGPASPTAITYEVVYWTSATARTERCFTAYDGNTASTASNGTAAKIFYVRGILRNGANAGTLIARAKREAVGTGPNVRAGSYGLLYKIT